MASSFVEGLFSYSVKLGNAASLSKTLPARRRSPWPARGIAQQPPWTAAERTADALQPAHGRWKHDKIRSLIKTQLEDAGLGHTVGGEDFKLDDLPGLRRFKRVDAFAQIVEQFLGSDLAIDEQSVVFCRLGLRAAEGFVRALVAAAEHQFALQTGVESDVHFAECGRPGKFQEIPLRLQSDEPMMTSVSRFRLRVENSSSVAFAEEYGYTSLYFFSRQFRQVMGCSPTEWKRRGAD